MFDVASVASSIKVLALHFPFYIGCAGEPVQLDMLAFIENGRTYLPLCFIMGNLGTDVVWDGANQTVTIIEYILILIGLAYERNRTKAEEFKKEYEFDTNANGGFVGFEAGQHQ